MTVTVSPAVQEAMLDSLPAPVHAVAEPGKALLSFNSFRVSKEGNMMTVTLLMDKAVVADWEIPAVDFDNDEVLTFAGFIANTQISLSAH